ncbi:class I SAM-dependent methyltransferase [Psychrobacter sp.]|uniref:class I SAM-dependent methyltransferase n=1 Tax=Psychrobacter sp. TaxID=56811 RepID=UPI0025EF2106|nr:class I SAM-dependent methyltransferase [Psychrobacter sp.]
MNQPDYSANIALIYSASTAAAPVIQALEQLIDRSGLSLRLQVIALDQKLTQKVRKQLSEHYTNPVLIIDDKLQLSLLMNHMSVAVDWTSLQRRVVSAGRKTELLLQACKLTDQSLVLDATAGFGHDSLILASTGAKVTMLERNPLMALLLMYEQYQMYQLPNWQKLMARLQIVCGDSAEYMATHYEASQTALTSAFNVIYLDPMFPENSYQSTATGKGAKVGKHMQALHHIAIPPDNKEEKNLLELSMSNVVEGGRVVVKRPASAPLFANCEPDESWHNDVVRFDGYFNKALRS